MIRVSRTAGGAGSRGRPRRGRVARRNAGPAAAAAGPVAWTCGSRIADVGLLAELGALKRLDLSGNRLADVSALGDLSGLVWLRLPGNAVVDASPLGRLTVLRWLWLDAGDRDA